MGSPTNQADTHPAREPFLDLVRGVAALFMIVSHALYYFSAGTSPWLTGLARTANTLTVSIFFLTSGAVTAHVLRHRPERAKAGQILRRFAWIYGIYLFLALTSAILNGTGVPSPDTLFSIILLAEMPSFTEFLVPLLAVPLLMYAVSPLTLRITARLYRVLLVSVAAFGLGMWLYWTPVPEYSIPYKALLAGHLGMLRFPLLQYLPLFLIGAWWSETLRQPRSQRTALHCMIVSMLGALACIVISRLVPAGLVGLVYRWPPSVGFLAMGVAAYFCIHLFILVLLQKRLFTNRILPVLNIFGTRSLLLYVSHLAFLIVYQKVIGYTFYSEAFVLICSVAVLCGSYLLARSVHRNPRPQLMTRPVDGLTIVLSAWTAVALVIMINANPYSSPYGNVWRYKTLKDIPLALVKPAVTPTPVPPPEVHWYNDDFGFRRDIALTNDTAGALPQGRQISIPIDHAALVRTDKSREDAGDMMVVYEDKGQVREIPSRVVFPNTAFAILQFTLQSALPPGTDSASYVAYYGSDFPPAGQPLPENPAPSAAVTAVLGEEQTHPLLLTTNRKWFVKTEPAELLALTLKTRTTTTTDDAEYTYEIDSSGPQGTITQLPGTTHIEQIPVNELPVGEHTVRVINKTAGPALSSRRIRFYVSEPVYVAWTLDWEGWDIPDQTLNELAGTSSRFGKLPITHFFNPRIYLPDVVSPVRAQILTDWVLNRERTAGDEIAMHLHMHFDVLQAAGIPPKRNPHWGYRSHEGYDVFTTAYTQTELLQLLRWALEQFRTHGLPTPAGYRAGGWFADTNVLSALATAGFRYDASGRERSLWNGVAASPWNLPITTQPYYPSQADQNRPGTPALTLLEIPHTGNTNEHTGPEIIKRYNMQVTEDYVSRKTAVVLMSHPQWADIELPRITEALAYIHQRAYANDAGPVVYVPLSTIYSAWK